MTDWKKIRVKLNWTQEKMANHLGIPQSIYSLYETGKRPDVPKKHMLKMLNLDYETYKDTIKILSGGDLNV